MNAGPAGPVIASSVNLWHSGAPMNDLMISRRFNGPPDSGNGGWTAGALAAHIDHDCPDNRAQEWPTVEVSLRQPPPLDTPLLVTTEGDLTVASFGGARIVEARVAGTVPLPVEPVDAAIARAAEASYAGFSAHPFPTCFACGPDREVGDGLRIFPGRVDGDRVAATWTPHPSLGEDFHTYVDDTARASLASTWAALDCIGGWSSDLTNRPMVLARIAAHVDALPVIGESHVVVGTGRSEEGRKVFTASTLYDADGRVVATAEHLWITIDPEMFGS